MKDQSKISNAVHEIRGAAKRCNVPVYVVHLAKHITGSNDRKVVYDWVEANKQRVSELLEGIRA